MDKKKILIASVSFYPRISPRSLRATELAKEFSRQGHEVLVLTHMGQYDYTQFCKENNLMVKDFTGSFWQHEKKTNSGNTFHYYLRTLVIYLLKYLFLWPDIKLSFLLAKLLKKESGFDLLISVAVPYPVHWGVVKAIKRNPSLTRKWVADCGDPFLKYGAGLKKPFYFKYIDNWFLKNADVIAIPYKELLVYFNPKFHRKFEIVPQGIDFSKIKLAQYKRNAHPTLAYSGIFIRNFRDPRIFLDYLCTLDCDFKFVVYTKTIEVLSEYVNRLKGKLEIRDYIPRYQLINELSKMDFLINIQNGNKIDYPSKLIDYALSKRPVLQINSFTLDETSIIQFFNADYQSRLELKDVAQYNITNVVKCLLNLQEQ
jgi:hypothetical protein